MTGLTINHKSKLLVSATFFQFLTVRHRRIFQIHHLSPCRGNPSGQRVRIVRLDQHILHLDGLVFPCGGSYFFEVLVDGEQLTVHTDHFLEDDRDIRQAGAAPQS